MLGFKLLLDIVRQRVLFRMTFLCSKKLDMKYISKSVTLGRKVKKCSKGELSRRREKRKRMQE